MKCPKCGFVQKESNNCANCGVIFRKFKQAEGKSQDFRQKARHFLGDVLGSARSLVVRQKVEVFEAISNWETANKYEIFDQRNRQVAYADEFSGDTASKLLRNVLGSHRGFEINVYKTDRNPLFTMKRDFFWLEYEVRVRTSTGVFLGSIQKNFNIIYKSYELKDHKGHTFAKIKTPLWKPWTFSITGVEGAGIFKKMSGLKEIFTDADNFRIEYQYFNWTINQKAVILATAFCIDFDYFESSSHGAGD